MLKNRAIAHEYYNYALKAARKKGDDELREVMRQLCRRDLFYLLVYVCGRDDMDNNWLYSRCREVQSNPDGHLDLWAREHYKSTIITYGKTIQDILINPEITVGIFSFNRPTAKSFLRQIKREFENNDVLKMSFPDVLYDNPARQSSKWSEDDGIIVKRSLNPKEATVEAWGLVDSQPTGKHYKLMVYDDVVTRESVTNPDMIAKVTETWELSRNLTSDGGKTRYVGTRYHYADTYQTIIDRQAARIRIYPGTIDGTETGKPVLWSKERLEEKRREMGVYVFACQILQNPLPEAQQKFKKDWLMFWGAQHYKGMNIYVFVDPANGKKKKSDYTTMFVVGLGADENFYIISMLRDRINLKERTNALFNIVRNYRPKMVYYEEYGLQSDIQHIQDRQDRENYRFHIEPIGGQTSKHDRIMRLEPLFESRRVYLPDSCIKVNCEGEQEDLTKVFINDEYLSFPYMAHDDMLDCLARIVDPNTYLSFPANSQGNVIGMTREMLHLVNEEEEYNYDALSIRATRGR